MDIYLFCDNIYFSDVPMHNWIRFYKQLAQFNGLRKMKTTECAIVCFLVRS